MKFFIDTEFCEGTQAKRFLGFKYGDTKPTIDLISIAIISEGIDLNDIEKQLSDNNIPGFTQVALQQEYITLAEAIKGTTNRAYYAISKDFNLYEAWNRFQLEQQSGDMRNVFPEGKKVYWLRDNVLKPIFYELKCRERSILNKKEDYPRLFDKSFTYNNFKKLINKYGKTNKQIAEEIKEFVYSYFPRINGISPWGARFPIEFYSYYGDYDWVVFCQLYGKMINLPTHFPMFCIDLKQTLNEKCVKWSDKIKGINLMAIDEQLEYFKKQENYPKQIDNHNALADSKFAQNLYYFLKDL